MKSTVSKLVEYDVEERKPMLCPMCEEGHLEYEAIGVGDDAIHTYTCTVCPLVAIEDVEYNLKGRLRAEINQPQDEDEITLSQFLDNAFNYIQNNLEIPYEKRRFLEPKSAITTLLIMKNEEDFIAVYDVLEDEADYFGFRIDDILEALETYVGPTDYVFSEERKRMEDMFLEMVHSGTFLGFIEDNYVREDVERMPLSILKKSILDLYNTVGPLKGALQSHKRRD